MAKRKKVTKRELKQDPLLNWILETTEYLKENKKVLNYIVIGILVSGLIILWGFNYVKSSRVEVVNLVDEIIKDIESEDYTNARTKADELNRNWFDFKLRNAGNFFYGEINYYEKNYDEAINYYKKYISKANKNDRFFIQAYSSLASIYEDKNDFENAGKTYLEIANLLETGSLSSFYYAEAGRCFEKAGMYKEARDAYETASNTNTELITETFKEYTKLKAKEMEFKISTPKVGQ